MHEIFRHPKFSETLKGCPRIFSALWDQNFSTEKRDTPYYAWNFSIPQTFWNIEGMPTKFFGTVRSKFFDGKTWYPLLCMKFFDTPNFLKHWRDAHEVFGHCETKNFRRKNVTLPPPPPFSSIKLFETKHFLKNTKIPLQNFSALWDTKISTENRDRPPLVLKFFSIPEIFWKTEGFPYKAFRFSPLRQKKSTKPWCPPLLSMKIFDKRIFLKHQSVLQWNILVQCDENFSTENRDTPPLLPIKNLSLPEIFWNTEWFPGEGFSVL